MGNSAKPIKQPFGDNMVSVHVTMPYKLYKSLYNYKNDLPGQPSISGVVVTALRQWLDETAYLGDA